MPDCTNYNILKFRLSNDVLTRKHAELMFWIYTCTNSLKSYIHLTEKQGDIMTESKDHQQEFCQQEFCQRVSLSKTSSLCFRIIKREDAVEVGTAEFLSFKD